MNRSKTSIVLLAMTISGISSCGNSTMPLIHSSALEGDLASVRTLLGKGENINQKNSAGKSFLGFTPLHMAINNGHTDIALFLLDKGADINAVNNAGNTPLHLAAYNGLLDLVEALVEKGANINAARKDGQTPLHMAAIAIRNNQALIRLLLDHGANINSGVGSNSGTPLEQAAYYGDADIGRFLIENGADVNARNGYGGTALHMAEKFGRTRYIEVLLENHADVNAKRKNGDTPLHWAAYNGHTLAAEVLIENGAQLDIKNKDGDTPLDYAVDKDKENTVALLEKYNGKKAGQAEPAGEN